MSSPFNLGVQRTTATPMWRTPGHVFEKLDAEFHFTLDPAASGPIRSGIRWFSEVDQGLWQPWSGSVFLNPPYGRAIADWMQKITTERERCEVIVALVPSRTDSAWWHDHAMPADEIRFIRGRLRFEGIDAPLAHNAPFPSVVLVYRGLAVPADDPVEAAARAYAAFTHGNLNGAAYRRREEAREVLRDALARLDATRGEAA